MVTTMACTCGTQTNTQTCFSIGGAIIEVFPFGQLTSKRQVAKFIVIYLHNSWSLLIPRCTVFDYINQLNLLFFPELIILILFYFVQVEDKEVTLTTFQF